MYSTWICRNVLSGQASKYFQSKRYLDSTIAFDDQQRVILKGNQDQLTQYSYWQDGGMKDEYELSLVKWFRRGKYDYYQERMIWEKPFYRSSRVPEGQVTPIGQNRYQIRKHTKYNEEGVVVGIARFDDLPWRM